MSSTTETEAVISLKSELASLKILASEKEKLFWDAFHAKMAAQDAAKTCETKLLDLAAKEYADFAAKVKAVTIARFEARPRLPFDRRHRWLTCEERNAICRFVRAGIHPIEIALKMGCTPSTVSTYKNSCGWHCDEEPSEKNPWSDKNILS